MLTRAGGASRKLKGGGGGGGGRTPIILERGGQKTTFECSFQCFSHKSLNCEIFQKRGGHSTSGSSPKSVLGARVIITYIHTKQYLG